MTRWPWRRVVDTVTLAVLVAAFFIRAPSLSFWRLVLAGWLVVSGALAILWRHPPN